MPDSTRSAPDAVRDFAVDVVRTLRDAGFMALWAGGCVRDSLLGRRPKDYDVASAATPEQVIEVFGRRRTVPVGASFGVVMVLGPHRACGQVEVATFRTDGRYLDGRRPSSVHFCSAEEDARRRDFTINGMFFDPLQEQVIDYVGGRADLAAGIVRAIGCASDRFTEDKLRMLRAIRFAATFGFELEAHTAAAIQSLARDIGQVSVERIAQELRRMLAHFTRERSFRLLQDTELLPVLFPQIYSVQAVPDPAQRAARQQHSFEVLKALSGETFEPALCAVLLPLYQPDQPERQRAAAVRRQCQQLKLSGAETDAVVWLAESLQRLQNAEQLPLHTLKPLLADARRDDLLHLAHAVATASAQPPVDADFCRRYLASTSQEQLNPEPLIDGQDLKALAVPSGPQFRRILDQLRREQLDEQLLTRPQALQRLQQLVQSG